MKQQLLVIHGGTSFDTYEEYIEYLRTRELTLERLQTFHDWKVCLAQKLGENFEVFLPKMPNSSNARFEEWKIWFERCAALCNDDVILIGHSLGGIFLAKYLAEHSFAKRIKATILVAAPWNDTSTEESLREFSLPASLEKLESQGGQIYLFHSKNDPVVPFEQLEMYQRALPGAKSMVFEDRGHFNAEDFSEMAELVCSL